MISEFERRLSEFVDRDDEIKRFCALLDQPDKLVMSITGPGGIGKSSLMARMVHEIANRGLMKVEVVYTDDNLPEFMAIMRKCRDDVGVAAFLSFTDLINYYTVPRYTLKVELHGGNVNVANNLTMTDGATAGDIAGVMIKDSMITFPRSDLDVAEAERRAKLTGEFVLCLARAAQQHRQIVILIDAAEKMSDGTKRWLWDSLIAGIADAKIANVRFVILSRAKPDIDRWKKQMVEFAELQPLTIPDVILYLEKRGVGPAHREALAQMVFAISRGNPFDIANHVDVFLDLQERQTAGAR
jgi:GTPase SAR1 family protein